MRCIALGFGWKTVSFFVIQAHQQLFSVKTFQMIIDVRHIKMRSFLNNKPVGNDDRPKFHSLPAELLEPVRVDPVSDKFYPEGLYVSPVLG